MQMIGLLRGERLGIEVHNGVTDLANFVEIGHEDLAVNMPFE